MAANSAPNVLDAESVPQGQHQISSEKPSTNGAGEGPKKHWLGEKEKQADMNGDEKKQQGTNGGDKKQGEVNGGGKGDKDGKDGGEEKGPAGGFDAIPVPKRPRGWTMRITIHKAKNLPPADINTMSSDPYVITEMTTDTPSRHKEDPPLRMRTSTVRRNIDPEWNATWIVANVPSSGCKLKMRVFDEDPSDHDDRLGNVHVHVGALREGWEGIHEQAYKLGKRAGSKRAYFARGISTCFGTNKHLHGELFVSVELLGRTAEDGQNGRVYTVGPCWSIRHYSPLLGRLANTAEPDENEDRNEPKKKGKDDKPQTKRYDFQANQIQLKGPMPAELYHRFVEFKPWVQRMFTGSGAKGYFLSKALHHQHSRVYHFDRSTEWTQLSDDAGSEMTKQFLRLVHYDQGARIFTYVLSLDGLWRFTETGKEFGIDMLSKHTMHSDVSLYIAFSGEFFIRRLKHPRQPSPPEPVEESSQSHPPEHGENPMHPPKDISGGPPKGDPPNDPAYYELVIDNDSGTYRPNAQMLPLLKAFLSRNLPGMHFLTLDCQKDEEMMGKMKDEQRERKKQEGDGIVFLQDNDGSSISSSDEEDLNALQSHVVGGRSRKNERGTLKKTAKDVKMQEQAKWGKAKRSYGGKKRVDGAEVDDEGSSPQVPESGEATEK